MLPRAFGGATGILARAQAGHRLAGAIVGAGMALPFAPLVWVLVFYEHSVPPWKAMVVLFGAFTAMGFLAPRLFTWFLRFVGAVADLIP